MRVLLAGKPNDANVSSAIRCITKYLKVKYSNITLISVDTDCQHDDLCPFDSSFDFDYGISVGGDGTVLHMNNFFPACTKPPPIIPFSLGTLGFLLPFRVEEYKDVIDGAIGGELPVVERDRLECTIENSLVRTAALNEVGIGRANGLKLVKLQCSADGRALTNVIADGAIVATGTGSTAYSLSAGGPVMHPSCSSIIFCPICPRSLSFRPLVLPSSSKIELKNASDGRQQQHIEVNMDGRIVASLSPGQSIRITKARHPLQTFAYSNHEWMDRINRLLGWNRSFAESACASSN